MGTLHEDQYTFLITSCSTFLRMRNFSDTSFRENKNIHIMFSHFSEKKVPFMRQCGKYCRARQVTDVSMAHAH